MKRIFFAGLGWVSIVLAVIGIFLPLLPTTPFLLLASWCFARSSRHFHTWLQTHPTLGPIITTWESGEGLTLAVKARILIVMWFGMIISMLILSRLMVTVGLFAIGFCVMFYILKQPTKASATNSNSPP